MLIVFRCDLDDLSIPTSAHIKYSLCSKCDEHATTSYFSIERVVHHVINL